MARGTALPSEISFAVGVSTIWVVAYNQASWGQVVSAMWRSYFYTSRVPLSPAGQLSQDAYGLLSLRGTWTAPSGAWTIAVWGNNITDEEFNVFSAGGFLGNNYTGPAGQLGCAV